MAKTRSRSTIKIDLSGLIPGEGADERAAVRRAQEKNALAWERRVKELAAVEVKHARAGTEFDPKLRNRGRYPADMAEYYSGRVDKNGDVVGENPTARAGFFEFGTDWHVIQGSAFEEGSPGRQTPPRGSRGRFSRGARAVRFPSVGNLPIIRTTVLHPGQQANPIMDRAMEEGLDEYGQNLLDELEAEIMGGGGRRG